MQPAMMTATTEVQPVPAREIPATWPTLQEGLNAIRDKAEPTLSFELIHERLIQSEAFLFLAPEGFFILLPIHGRIPSVLVWQAQLPVRHRLSQLGSGHSQAVARVSFTSRPRNNRSLNPILHSQSAYKISIAW